MFTRVFVGALLALFVFIGAAAAEEWSVTRLRGAALQQVDGQWVNLNRNAEIPDERVIRTLANGHLRLQRGEEVLDLEPNTQIRISDAQDGSFTRVTQDFGQVTVEAKVENVPHFSVETPFLAAVVKGTKFVVASGASSAWVKVQRGKVSVADKKRDQTVVITAGQSAATNAGEALTVRDADGAIISGPDKVLGDILEDIGETGTSLVGGVVDTTTGVVGGVVDTTTGVVGGVVDTGTGAVSGVVGGVGGVVGSVTGGSDNGDDQSGGGLGVHVDLPGLHLGL